MRWPWTSKAHLDTATARLEDAQGEIAWLRERNEGLTEQMTRLVRKQAGMSETPRAARPAMEPMPRDLLEHIKKFANQSLQKHMRDQAYRRHVRGEPWADIRAEYMGDKDGEESQS